MENLLHWHIRIPEPPAILRHCRRCGGDRRFCTSGLFRVNAQHHRLDVWLLYRCEACEAAWKLTLHERVAISALDPAAHDGYLRNDPALARRCAFDRTALDRAHVTADMDRLAFSVDGPDVDTGALVGPVRILLCCDVDAPLRLEHVLRVKLSLTGSALRRLVEAGRVDCAGANIRRARLTPGLVLTLRP